MAIDFFYALVTGWIFLLVFWIFILIFIFIRKPPKSKLSANLVMKSIGIFLLGFLVLFIFF